MKWVKLICFFFLSVMLFTACNTSKQDYKKGYQDGYADGLKAATANNNVVVNPNPRSNNTDPNFNPNVEENKDVSNKDIPDKVITVLNYVKKNHEAPDGYVGGRHFGNYERLLPERDAAGNRIEYQEWDVNAKEQGKNRGTQRLITGSDGRAWYTNNHYKSFTEVK
ncbi:MAG: ribonuclease domain-containing protein [Chitinophagales bacterium]